MMEDSAHPVSPVLIVDDEPQVAQVLAAVLRMGGVTNIVLCHDSRDVIKLLAKNPFSAVILDLTMPYLPGHVLLPQLVERDPAIPVVIVTGADDVGTAVDCMRHGAFDYMVKPVETQRLVSGIKRAIESFQMRADSCLLTDQVFRRELARPEAFQDILTVNAKMHAIFHYTETIAATNKPVLITGETGTGKELVSRALHKASGRRGSFLAVNVAGVDDNVFSDTLFGHVRGAYTGAEMSRPGLLETASAGTIFLDEIGDLTSASQVKLLRLLQEREYFPLGADVPKFTEARILVATNKNLDECVENNHFRRDLYYRLQVHRIHVPPLRERLDDLPLLLDHFLEQAAGALEKKKPTPPRELVDLLATYPFPGNIRELEAMVYTAVTDHKGGKLSMDSFKNHMERARFIRSATATLLEESAFQLPETFPTLKETAEFLVAQALKKANGNQSIAAELLGITPSALNKRLRKGLRSADEKNVVNAVKPVNFRLTEPSN